MPFVVLPLLAALAPEVSVALIALVGVLASALIAGPFMWLLQRAAKKADQHHAFSVETLNEIRDDVAAVKSDTSETKSAVLAHLAWHAHLPPPLYVIPQEPA